jgi:hypothetical protein
VSVCARYCCTTAAIEPVARKHGATEFDGLQQFYIMRP